MESFRYAATAPLSNEHAKKPLSKLLTFSGRAHIIGCLSSLGGLMLAFCSLQSYTINTSILSVHFLVTIMEKNNPN